MIIFQVLSAMRIFPHNTLNKTLKCDAFYAVEVKECWQNEVTNVRVISHLPHVRQQCLCSCVERISGDYMLFSSVLSAHLLIHLLLWMITSLEVATAHNKKNKTLFTVYEKGTTIAFKNIVIKLFQTRLK